MEVALPQKTAYTACTAYTAYLQTFRSPQRLKKNVDFSKVSVKHLKRKKAEKWAFGKLNQGQREMKSGS